MLHQNTYLGVLTPTSVVIPLDAALLAALSADGQLGIRVTSFGTNLFTHDFNLLSARLDATTVPEPTMLLLFGTAAAAAARRRFSRTR